jgi:hypothetical protein
LILLGTHQPIDLLAPRKKELTAMAPHPLRPDVTSAGTRNFEKLVTLAARPHGHWLATVQMADAFAALLAEVTPAHREVLSSAMTQRAAAPGRSRLWSFPAGITGGPNACQKWVSLVLLDCVDAISDELAGDHSLEERQEWTRRLRLYVNGADSFRIPWDSRARLTRNQDWGLK